MQQELFDITYKLVRTRRKSVAIHVYRNGEVEVRAPRQASKALIHAFVLEKQDWIAKKQSEWQALPARHEPRFTEGSGHYFLGELHRLCFSQASNNAEPIIQLRVQKRSPDNVAKALDRWYRQQAEAVCAERHDYWREQLRFLRLPSSSLAYRKMKSRWGSCGRSGKITLNTQLMRYPLECVDAVIVHELCHLLEFNHSPRFYELMDIAYPDWKKTDVLLKELSLQY